MSTGVTNMRVHIDDAGSRRVCGGGGGGDRVVYRRLGVEPTQTVGQLIATIHAWPSPLHHPIAS